MFNGVYSRNNLPKTKDGAYAINLDEFKSTGTLLDSFVCAWNNRSASSDAMEFWS